MESVALHRPVVPQPGPSQACPACGARDHETLAPLRTGEQHRLYAQGNAVRQRRLDRALAAGPKRYAMLRCRGCGLEFALPAQAPPPQWYAALYAALDLYPASRWEYTVVEASLQRSARLLDYGCGSGHFLAAAAPLVKRATGVDFAAACVAEAVARGLDVQLVPPGAAPPTPAEPADHVTAFHVLEHLAEPAALFRYARTAGSAQARLWVAVPSDRRASRRFGEPDALDAPPHHLTRWTEAALAQLGQRTGWALQRCLYEPLSASTRVWEATRRTAAYTRLEGLHPAPRRVLRRLLAGGVWLGGNHGMTGASGFSMLAEFALAPSPP